MENNDKTLLDSIAADLHKIAVSLDTIANSPAFRAPVPDVYRIGLINTTQYNLLKSRIPHYSGCWWLDAKERNPKEAPMVTKDDKLENVSSYVNWGLVRPALFIANAMEFGYKQCVRVGKCYFTYVGQDCLLCNTAFPVSSYLELATWQSWKWEQLIYGTWDWMLEKDRPSVNFDLPVDADITLLSEEEYTRLKANVPIFADPWWLRSEDTSVTIPAVVEGNQIRQFDRMKEESFFLRYVICLPKRYSNSFKERQSVSIGNLLFTYIGENKLILDVPSSLRAYDKIPAPWEFSDFRAGLKESLLANMGFETIADNDKNTIF